MSVFLDRNILDEFEADYRDAADQQVAREVGHAGFGDDRVHSLERTQDLREDRVTLRCSCGWHRVFSPDVLFEMAAPHIRRLAYERSALAKQLRHGQIAAEVADAPPVDASNAELVDQSKEALEQRDPEAAFRVIAQCLDPRRSA